MVSGKQEDHGINTMNSLELEESLPKQAKEARKNTPPWVVRGRYWMLSTLAVAAAIACPGQTLVRDNDGNVDLLELSRVIGSYAVLWLAFFVIHGR